MIAPGHLKPAPEPTGRNQDRAENQSDEAAEPQHAQADQGAEQHREDAVRRFQHLLPRRLVACASGGQGQLTEPAELVHQKGAIVCVDPIRSREHVAARCLALLCVRRLLFVVVERTEDPLQAELLRRHLERRGAGFTPLLPDEIIELIEPPIPSSGPFSSPASTTNRRRWPIVPVSICAALW